MHELRTLRSSKLSDRGYSPGRLLDNLNSCLGLHNDADLARVLQIHPAVLSKIRHHVNPVSAELTLRIHDVTDIPIHTLRSWMNVTVDIKKRLPRPTKEQ